VEFDVIEFIELVLYEIDMIRDLIGG